jgi:hypothetical protein
MIMVKSDVVDWPIIIISRYTHLSKATNENTLLIYGHIKPKNICTLDLGLHIVDGVKTLCLEYDGDDKFPQRCGYHELCNTLDFSFFIVDSVRDLYGRGIPTIVNNYLYK